VRPVKTTICFTRYRLIRRHNDQTIRMDKIERQLSSAVAGQLVTTSLREIAQILQCRRSPQFIETPPDTLRLPVSVLLNQQFLAVDNLLELLVLEDYIHNCSLCQYHYPITLIILRQIEFVTSLWVLKSAASTRPPARPVASHPCASSQQPTESRAASAPACICARASRADRPDRPATRPRGHAADRYRGRCAPRRRPCRSPWPCPRS